MDLKALEFTKKTGSEEIIGHDKTNLMDFWRWAYSDIVGNTERGALAEYLVALACGVDDKIRISWDTYDLELKNGIKVEVKSSAYLQTWKQKSLSKPIFSIRETLAWDYIENVYLNEIKRHADIYVFALLAHTDKTTINPLDTTQWEFYVLNTKLINKLIKQSKQISLKKVIEVGAVKSSFYQLLENIILVNSAE